MYYQLEENKSPMGKTVYQSKVRSRIQLAGDKVGTTQNEQTMIRLKIQNTTGPIQWAVSSLHRSESVKARVV